MGETETERAFTTDMSAVESNGDSLDDDWPGMDCDKEEDIF